MLGIESTPARLSGSLRVRGEGDRFRELVGNLAGPVELRLKGEEGDSDIYLKAQTQLLTKGECIVGLNLDAVALAVAEKPVADGRVSLDATVPKIFGSLRSLLFDADELLPMLPRTAHERD